MLGDPAGGGFLAEVPENVSQLRGVEMVHNIGGGLADSRAHSHVQRTILLEGKTTRGLVELVGGNSQIQQCAVEETLLPQILDGLPCLAKIRFHEPRPISKFRQSAFALREGLGILIERHNLGA
jgi:hypothetical protein